LAAIAGLEDQARRLETLHLEIRLALSDARLATGEHSVLVQALQQMAAEHPLDERIGGQLMMALYRSGRQTDALACYARLRRALAEQLGIDPGQPLRDLEMAVLRRDPALELPTPAATVSSVLAPSEPAPEGPRRRSLVPAQLPPPVRAFEGRGAELDSLDAIAREAADAHAGAGTATMVAVISGTAGAGKTTLAVHWAHRVREWFPGGQLYVNLRGFDPDRTPLDPGEVLHGFLTSLGVPARSIPSGLDDRLGLYRSALAGRRPRGAGQRPRRRPRSVAAARLARLHGRRDQPHAAHAPGGH
jgi:hypothetical protein